MSDLRTIPGEAVRAAIAVLKREAVIDYIDEPAMRQAIEAAIPLCPALAPFADRVSPAVAEQTGREG